MNDFIGKICPYCKTEFKEGDDIVVCDKCEMPHHKGCWIENNGCTTFGCTGTISGVGEKFTEALEYEDGNSGAPATRYCTSCGAQNDAKNKFCKKCGAPMKSIEANAIQNDKPDYAEVNQSSEYSYSSNAKADNNADYSYTDGSNSEPNNGYTNNESQPYNNGYVNNGNPQYNNGYVNNGNPQYNNGYVNNGNPQYNNGYANNGSQQYNNRYANNGSQQYNNGYANNGNLQYNNGYANNGYNQNNMGYGQAQNVGLDQTTSMLIGEKQEYYAKHFSAMKAQNKKNTWNWPAFLVGPYWMMYRKMYKLAIIVIAIQLIASSFGALSWIVDIGLFVASGILGNYAYMTHLEKIKNYADAMREPQKNQFIQENGGLDAKATVIAVVAMVVLLILMNRYTMFYMW